MPILPMVSATKTLDKVMCLACDVKHSTFENGEYNICNDTIEHVRDGKIYQPVPFTFNIPSQSETDDVQIAITNIGLVCSNILKSADNSYEDILIQCWMIIANYDGTSSWLDLGEYVLSTTQVETIEQVAASLTLDSCFEINAGKFRGDNPEVFINLCHR